MDMKEFYGISAKLYDYTLGWLMFGREEDIRKKVAKLIPDKKLKILDAGCGTGSQLIEIKTKKKEAECCGVDASEDMLEIAKRKARNKNIEINFSCQSFTKLNFKKNYFDVVIAFLALHEINYGEREKAIKEIERVMKKNGKFILVDYVKTTGIARAIQKLIFFVFREYGDFIETKQELLKNFKKEYSKDILKVMGIEKYSKSRKC